MRGGGLLGISAGVASKMAVGRRRTIVPGSMTNEARAVCAYDLRRLLLCPRLGDTAQVCFIQPVEYPWPRGRFPGDFLSCLMASLVL